MAYFKIISKLSRIYYWLLCVCMGAIFFAQAESVKPVIVFDMHGVLTNVQYGQITKNICSALWQQPSLVTKLVNPQTFKNGTYIAYPSLRQVYNSHKPNEQAWALVRELKQAGYPLYLMTNSAETPFAEFKAQFPGYFELFDGCHIVPDDNPELRKPQPAAYQACKRLIEHKHPGRMIIFIDDSSRNCKAAQEAGFASATCCSIAELDKYLRDRQV